MRRIPVGLAIASFAVALLQRPGEASSDTKIDLHLDAAGFLADVASPWTDSFGLGAVWSGQYSGYLWPMGPFFAGGDALGLPAWLVHRLWLGALLALAAWGAVRLVDELHGRRRGAAHLVAGAVMVANPYVVVFTNRTSITLLAYAALPWLLVATHRGLRAARGSGAWWWAAAFALMLASAGGGVNAATTAWVLAGPVLLAAYEVWVLGLPWRAAAAFGARAVPLAAVANAWWVVPALVQSGYGIDFLRFTEQPSVIWHTTSLAESLRGMGYWFGYAEFDFSALRVPVMSDAGTLLFDRAVVVASLLLPALALAGFALGRRRPYAPFMVAMLVLGALVMAAGFPEGAPLRRAVTALYEGFEPVRFLRTTYKAGPLVLVAIAFLTGLCAEAVWWRVRRPAARVAVAGTAAAVLVLASLPLFTGRAVDEKVVFDVPPAWERAAADLDRDLPRGTRAAVLPGSLFGFYDWGATTDPALRALTDRPLAVRFVVPYSDLRAIDLLWTLDALVEERRALPGQLRPLLDLIGAGAVVAPFDYDAERAGSVPPAEAARALAEGGLGEPDRSYGSARAVAAPAGSLDAPLALPRLRRWDLGGDAGLVRVRPRAPATVVDGSAPGVAGLAAFGALDGRPLLYAADQDRDRLRELAREGATFVVSDSNRRRAFVNSRIRASTGRTLDAGAEIPPDVAVLDPFERGTDAQTVAEHTGARWVRGTIEASFSQFPERRPMAALDGDPGTAWITNAFLRPGERPYLEVGFEGRRDVEHVDLLPYGDEHGRPVEVEIGGRTHALRSGWNRLELGLEDVDSLRVEISRSAAPPRDGGPGGIRELRVPGLDVRERLRMPVLSARALAGEPLDRAGLSYLVERTSAASPWRRTPPAGDLQARGLGNRADAERSVRRLLEVPAERRFGAGAWVSPGPETPDAVLDRLAGQRGPVRFSSSGRFESVPGRRASRAFDGRRGSGWVGAARAGETPWLGWRSERPRRLSSFVLEPLGGRVRAPVRVRVRWEGGASAALPVGAGGRVTLPESVVSDRFRIEIVDARLPAGAGARRVPRAVGIAEVRGGGVPRVPAPRGATVRGRCGDAALTVAGARVPLRPFGSVRALDRGRPLRARGCRAARVEAGRHLLTTAAGPLRVDLLRLRSPAPQPVAASGGGRVVDPGEHGRGRIEDVRVEVDGPAWLVLGESYNAGWRATCDGRDLGEPVPVDGYANGWAVERCSEASFEFAPAGAVNAGYLVSLAAALGLLGYLLLRRPPAAPAAAPAASGTYAPRRLPLPWALAAGAVATPLLAFLFAIRAGVVLGPLLALVLWRGVGARTLAVAAAALLGLVVPAIYMLDLPPDLGGYNSNYAIDLIAAHWVAVLAVYCAALAAWRSAAALRASGREQTATRSSDASSPSGRSSKSDGSIAAARGSGRLRSAVNRRS